MGACSAFADLLSYPRADVLARVDTCLAELAGSGDGSAAGVRSCAW